MRRRPFPDHLVLVTFRPENRIQHDLEVMTRRRVAVQVQAAGRLQHPVQFHQPGGHHHQIGHHLVRADEAAQRLDHLGHVQRRVLDQIMVGLLGGAVPVPGVLECGDLGLALLAALLLEQHVIRPVAVEGRVEVDQIDRGIGHIFAQNRQVVAVEQGIFMDRGRHGPIIDGNQAFQSEPAFAGPVSGTSLACGRTTAAARRPTAPNRPPRRCGPPAPSAPREPRNRRGSG